MDCYDVITLGMLQEAAESTAVPAVSVIPAEVRNTVHIPNLCSIFRGRV